MSQHMRLEEEQIALVADADPRLNETLHLIARVMVWHWGTDPAEISDVARGDIWQSYARQCARDLGLLS